jgi:putative peptidoglycan lipid II flippase
VMLAMPCALALMVFPQALVSVLYHYGAFSANDVSMTVRALMGYGVGLLALIAIKILAPGFYARQDMRTPVRIAIGVLIFTQLMNLVFVPWIGHAGLALSISLGALVNAAFLLSGLLRLGVYRPRPGWGGFVLRVLLACGVLGGVLAWAARAIDWIGLQALWGQRAGWMALVLSGSVVLYFGVLWASGLNLRQFVRRG